MNDLIVSEMKYAILYDEKDYNKLISFLKKISTSFMVGMLRTKKLKYTMKRLTLTSNCMGQK
ncbi:hypothetical protein LPTSP4_09350 [Leptospira ryugenii]|uniref:Uncharacterized protein n=1 Tax=Leptospira ryugenii TaxID=1917863 RepID=A0A2P2DXR6_9LEPT|nr:hypothetical protein LPTSP4_09350 [Leptospira ryugenii]